jgi:mono/diheme cytochrome c family protein
MAPNRRRFSKYILGAWILLGWLHSAAAQPDAKPWTPNIPVVWDEAALADWATPVAGLNVRPMLISAKEYYTFTIENLRTYPVYFPGREPEGYWDMLTHVGPKPLIEPEKLKNESDWIEAGRRVFEEIDDLELRTFDQKIITAARSVQTFKAVKAYPLPDGTVVSMRWVPTKQGVALSFSNCSACHLLHMQDGTKVPGASGLARTGPANPLFVALHRANRIVGRVAPFQSVVDEPYGISLYRAYGVPWLNSDDNERLKAMTAADFAAVGVFRGGAVLRWNGNPFYPVKVPDLIGIKARKYLDHTASHLHRGNGDLMRYAAMVSFADSADFGPHHMLLGGVKRVEARLPDEALYALGLYIYSLQPPRNPNAFDEKAKAGQAIFSRAGCPTCHTPPLYTNNKLTLAEGFTPPNDKPTTLDILPISVHTDPGLALQTRKGTGYYKVPSLKGVWYRGHYLHDGSAASLEEMFDPSRLEETHVPGGWLPPGMKARAIKGHEFGLKLNPAEREQLIAFLRTL